LYNVKRGDTAHEKFMGAGAESSKKNERAVPDKAKPKNTRKNLEGLKGGGERN